MLDHTEQTKNNQWVENCLYNRKQFKEINGTKSCLKDVTSGVTRGNVLESVLTIL